MTVRRNEQIDNAKGILMTLVIFGHVLLASKNLVPSGSFVLKLIYSFHMPAFLIISGILFDSEGLSKKKFSEYICTKIKRILIPYLVFEALGGLIHNIFSYGEPESFLEVLKRIVTFHMYVGADWYLLTYFLVSLLLFEINKIKRPRKIIYSTAVIFFIVVCLLQSKDTSSRSVFILRLMLAYSLVVLGMALKDFLLASGWKTVLAAIVGLIISVLFNGNVFMHAVILNNPIFFLLGGVCGTYLILQLSSQVDNIFINVIGRYSIVPMGIHQNLIWILGWYFGLNGTWIALLTKFAVVYFVSAIATIIYMTIINRGNA